MNYYFHFTMFTMGELWVITAILGVFCFGVVWCGANFIVCLFFAKQQQSSNTLFLEDLVALRRAYKIISYC